VCATGRGAERSGCEVVDEGLPPTGARFGQPKLCFDFLFFLYFLLVCLFFVYASVIQMLPFRLGVDPVAVFGCH
jgi:hypothetical protein